MTLVRTSSLVEQASATNDAVLALNVITLEHAEAIATAAEATSRAAILQISHNAVRYHGRLEPLAHACAEIAEASDAQLALHLDHVEDIELIRCAPAAGFSSAMFDAGALPYAENVAATRTAADWAHQHDLWLEAELGFVGGKPDTPISAHADGARTDPDEAREYVAATGVDTLAVAVGSSHAMTERTAVLDIDLVERLRNAVPVPLVLHGSSGVPDDQLAAAIEAGMTKINIGTALNLAFTAAVRESLHASDSTDPRRYLRAGRESVVEAVSVLLERFAAVTPAGRPHPVR